MIRKAITDDKASVCEIYKQAKESMRKNGIDQWQDGYPNGDSFSSDCENGISIVAVDEGHIIATAAAYIGHEPTYDKIFDGKWLTDNGTYGIIHRIAVSTDAKKKGVATSIVEYTEILCRENSISSMRCDTHRDNKLMQGMLKKNGYKYCGIIYLDNGDERLGFEKLL